ncbi:MAG TPA: collagen-binding domain-containing protein [Rhodocyclaceae bacterium]|nr:collagen-binding domain-containing protein [Rhodocyclaceae bacterium]
MFKQTALTHPLFHRISLVLTFITATGAAHASSVYNLGVAGNFSAFVFGDMTVTGSTDAEHSVAAQGNFKAGTWTAAQGGATYSTGGKDWAVVVGGNVNWSDGSVMSGATYVGGSLTVGSANNPTLDAVQQGGASPVDFAAAKSQLTAESARLMNMTATGTTLYGGDKSGGWDGGIYLQGSNKSVEYFTLDSSKLTTGNVFQQLSLDSGFAAGSTIVLNIIGSATEIALANLNSVLGFNGHETLLNFASNISKITLSSLNADATVLALNADLTDNGGNINGGVIAKSFTGSAQLNGGHPGAPSQASTEVPEPGSLALVALGCVGLAATRKRKQG